MLVNLSGAYVTPEECKPLKNISREGSLSLGLGIVFNSSLSHILSALYAVVTREVGSENSLQVNESSTNDEVLKTQRCERKVILLS